MASAVGKKRKSSEVSSPAKQSASFKKIIVKEEPMLVDDDCPSTSHSLNGNGHIITSGSVSNDPIPSFSTSPTIPLPPDWIVCHSKRLNRPYFFNTTTGESLWHKPDYRSPLQKEQLLSNASNVSNPNIPRFSGGEHWHTFNGTISHQQASQPTVSSIRIQPKPENVSIPNIKQEFTFEEPMDVDDNVVNQIRRDFRNDLNKISMKTGDTNGWNFDNSFRERHALVYVVIDTNIWLKHLDFIKEIEKMRFNREEAVIVVPYVVLQELDFLKDSRKRHAKVICSKLSEISQQASSAIIYIYEKMQSHSAQILCQPALIDAAHDTVINVNGVCSNDDRVLKCALQMMKRIPIDDKILLLCTNDKNLINKAGANEIVAGEHKHLSFLLNDMVYNTQRYVQPPKRSSNSRMQDPESLTELKNSKPSSLEHASHDYPDGNSFEDILEFTLLVFSQIVENEFRRVYDKDADRIFIIKPPWESLKVVIEVVLKHWVAVYKYMWNRMGDFQTLYKYLILKRQMDITEEIEVLRLIEKLLNSIKDVTKKLIPITAKALSKKIEEFFADNHIEDDEDKKAKWRIKSEKKCKKSDEDYVIPSSPNNSKKKSSGKLVAEHWAEISMEENEKKRVRKVCQDVWNFLERKRDEWTKVLTENSKSHDKKTEARQNLLKLCRVSQALLDSMDAVFRDPQPKKGEEFSSLAHFPGAESFLRLLSHFPSCLDKTVKKFDTVLYMRSFQLFMSDSDDRRIFESAGNHLSSLIAAVTNDLRSVSQG